MGRNIGKAGKLTGRNQTSRNFAGIPRIVMENPDFRALSPNARNLLLILAYYYKGKNNGDLSCSFNTMKDWGYKAPETLNKAKKELIEKNMIIETRTGRFLNPGGYCSLYALTWQPIDECNGKLEVKPTTTPIRKFSMEQ